LLFSFLSPLYFLLSLWGVLPNLLSSNTSLKLLLMHYDILAIPFIYIAALKGVKIIKRKKSLAGVVLIASILTNALFSQYPIHKAFRIREFPIIPQDIIIDKLASLIPPSASVSTQDYISVNLIKRRRLYVFPVYYDKVDYILIAEKTHVWPLSNEEQKSYIEKINKNPDYKLFQKEGGYLLYKRKK